MSSYASYIAPKSITDPTVAATATSTKAVSTQVKKAAQDFEAMFISEMFRPIFDMQEQNPEFSGGSSESIYRSMLVDEYGKGMAKSGGIGIAKHVEKELMKLQEAKTQTPEISNVASK